MRAPLGIALVFLFAEFALAQQITVVGAGFFSAVPIPAAPGEILTIHVAGLGGVNQTVTAASVPLPTTLAGISIAMTQGVNGETIPVPLIAAFPVKTCTDIQTAGCSQFVGITLQVPYELVPNTPFVVGRPPNSAQLAITQAGQTALVDLEPVYDSVHILRGGDSITQPGRQAPGTMFLNPIVTHSDGSPVLQPSPARPGETLVMYAVGLGTTAPSATTGDKSPTAATVAPITIGFTFQAPPGTSPPSSAVPVFAGLTPGFVGLYQINFVVPQPPTTLQLCIPGGSPASNLSVTLYAQTSLDVAGICVRP